MGALYVDLQLKLITEVRNCIGPGTETVVVCLKTSPVEAFQVEVVGIPLGRKTYMEKLFAKPSRSHT